MNDYSIKVEGVYKDFVLPHERAGSVKGIFTSLFRNSSSKKESQHALKNISFEIKKGEFFGIVGRNGSGKSTVLKILAGIYQPTKGKVNVQGKLVPFIELGVGFNPELSGRDNVYLNGAMLGFSAKEIEEMYDGIVEFAELDRFMDQKLKNYSSGMQVRLAFSMATRARADILLVDEILAVGDADFQRKCFDYFRELKGAGTTVIFVTHDMNAVREYCDRAILIEKSEIVAVGSPAKISGKYSKMFIEENDKNEDYDVKMDKKRWGDEKMVYTKVMVEPKKLTSSVKEVVFRFTAIAREDVVSPIVGFTVKNAALIQVLGNNSMLAQKPIGDIKKGQSIEIVWTIPNIFNDGLHYVDPAIVYNSGSQIADWWEEAATFRVLKEDTTPYIVAPPMELKIKK